MPRQRGQLRWYHRQVHGEAILTSSTAPNAAAFRRLWWGVFLVAFPLGILAFVLPIYGRELGASAVEVGAFFSAFSIVPVVVRPFLGRALDRWGRRPFLLLGLAGYAAAMALFVFADSVILLTVARFVQGLGQAFLWLSAYTIVADLAAAHGRGRDFGSVDEAANRGALFGTSAGFGLMFALSQAGLTLTQSWAWIFPLYAVPALVALAVVWRGVPETRPAAEVTPVKSRPISSQLLALMGIVAMTGASNAMVWPLLMIFLQDSLGAGIEALAMAYLPAAILSSFLPSRMGHFADRLGRKPLMVVGLVGGALPRPSSPTCAACSCWPSCGPWNRWGMPPRSRPSAPSSLISLGRIRAARAMACTRSPTFWGPSSGRSPAAGCMTRAAMRRLSI